MKIFDLGREIKVERNFMEPDWGQIGFKKVRSKLLAFTWLKWEEYSPITRRRRMIHWEDTIPIFVGR